MPGQSKKQGGKPGRKIDKMLEEIEKRMDEVEKRMKEIEKKIEEKGEGQPARAAEEASKFYRGRQVCARSAFINATAIKKRPFISDEPGTRAVLDIEVHAIPFRTYGIREPTSIPGNKKTQAF